MNKRGISEIVVIVLLLLVAIAAVLIFWMLFSGFLGQSFEDFSIMPIKVDLRIEKKICGVGETGIAQIKIKRSSGVGNVSGIRFVFSNLTPMTYIHDEKIFFGELETKTFLFNVSQNISNVSKIIIAPIITIESGKEVLGIPDLGCNLIEDSLFVPDACQGLSCEGKECGFVCGITACGNWGGGCGPGKICNDASFRCEEICGNGAIDVGEECDGSNLNGKTCLSQGFSVGTLACDSCMLDTSSCITCVDIDSDGYNATLGCGAELDCNDNDNSIFPGASEVCDNKNNDCNGATADGSSESWFNEPTSCGIGSCVRTGILQCLSGSQTDSCVAGTPGIEICDGANNDENCDGVVDEGCSCTNGATRPCGSTDVGLCSYGIQTCVAGAWQATCIGSVEPQIEICDGNDNNCNGVVDEGVKNTYYRDADGDGYGNVLVTIQACSAPAGYVSNNNDCNDADSAIHPGLAEVCDNKNNDCNGATADGSSESWFNQATSCGIGTCARTGSWQCIFGVKTNSCVAGGTPNCACAANTCIGSSCSDGCGGTCPGTKQPNCAGKECGSDGCGGTCGSCDVLFCSPSGLCVNQCNGIFCEPGQQCTKFAPGDCCTSQKITYQCPYYGCGYSCGGSFSQDLYNQGLQCCMFTEACTGDLEFLNVPC